MLPSQSGIFSSGKIPEKNTWGTATSGINWIIWNSELANVEMKIPIDNAVIAKQILIKITYHKLPAKLMFNKYIENRTMINVWMIANIP